MHALHHLGGVVIKRPFGKDLCRKVPNIMELWYLKVLYDSILPMPTSAIDPNLVQLLNLPIKLLIHLDISLGYLFILCKINASNN
jgi:hypothetical protein